MRVDPDLLRQQIVSHIGRLRRFAFALTGKPYEADDLLQATIQRVLEKGAPEDADIAKWMFRVCRNLWIDQLRAQRVRSAAVETGKIETNRYVDGEKDALARLSLHHISELMDDLPEKQRLVLSLVALEGYSYREVAEILETPIGTVMSRLARARKTLADQLEEKTIEAEDVLPKSLRQVKRD